MQRSGSLFSPGLNFCILSSLRCRCSCRCAVSAACCRVGGQGGRAPCQAGVVGAGMPMHGASEQRQHEHGVTGTSWGKGVPRQGQVPGTAGHALPQCRAGRTCSGQAGRADIAMQMCRHCDADVLSPGRARACPWCRKCSPRHAGRRVLTQCVLTQTCFSRV